MSGPIDNRIRGIFVHVTDMQRSIKWYSELLNLSLTSSSHEGTIYDIPLKLYEKPDLILDANAALTQHDGKHPMFLLDTKDIHAAYAFLKEKGVELVSGIEDIGSVSFVAFKDPDGNILMACQDNE
jgi:predicted enzyme related to lactoylglutathione lyase